MQAVGNARRVMICRGATGLFIYLFICLPHLARERAEQQERVRREEKGRLPQASTLELQMWELSSMGTC